MPNENLVIIMGNLGRDPDTKFLTDGRQVTTFSVATSKKFKEKEQVEWHSCVSYGKVAEIVSKYFSKGTAAFVKGSLHYRKWEGKDGTKHEKTEIIAQRIQLLSPKKTREPGDDSGPDDPEMAPF